MAQKYVISIVKFSEKYERFWILDPNAQRSPSYTDRVVFEKQVAPLVLDIEEKREHDDDVDHSDEGHDDKSAVHDQNSQLIYSENFSI